MQYTPDLRRRAARAILLVASALSLVAAGHAPRQAPQFRSGVELVQLQVGVVDAEGNFPAGLAPENFVLRIDGEVRAVQVAYPVDLRAAPSSAAEAPSPGSGDPVATASTGAAATVPETLPAAARRHFLIFFDLSFNTRRGLLEARESALRFIDEGAHPSDLIGVATAGRFGIRLLTPFTADREAARQSVLTLGLEGLTDQVSEGTGFEESIAQALSELSGTRAGGGGIDMSDIAAANFRQLEAEVGNYQSQLKAFGEMLQAIEGRKQVLFFSRGFNDVVLVGTGGGMASDPGMTFGSPEVREGMEEMVGTLQRVDAAVHAIDTSGSQAPGDPSSFGSGGSSLNSGFGPGGISSGRQALTQLAADTGGTLHLNRNDFGDVLTEIEQQTAAYYLIGYARRPEDPPTVQVDVRVDLPGLRVVSAPRQLSPPPDYRAMSPAQRQLRVAESLNDTADRVEVLFDSQVVPYPVMGDGSLAVVLFEVPGAELERLAAMRGDDRVELEVVALALDAQARVVAERRRGVGVALDDLRAAGPVAAQSLRFSEALAVPSGDLRVRLLLREAQAGQLSARTLRTWVPPASGMRVARPLVVAAVDPASARLPESFDPLRFEGRRLSVEVTPRLQPGQRVQLLVGAVGLARDRATGTMDAGVGLEMVDMEGEPRPVEGWTVLVSTYDAERDLTRLLLEFRVPEPIAAGPAQLWTRFFDRGAGRRAEEQVGVLVQGL